MHGLQATTVGCAGHPLPLTSSHGASHQRAAVQAPMNILSSMFPHRLKLFHACDYAGVIEVEKTYGRSSLQLVSTKLCDNNTSSTPDSPLVSGSKTLHCYYWTVSGPAMSTLTPQAALEELGCFGALSSRKVSILRCKDPGTEPVPA